MQAEEEEEEGETTNQKGAGDTLCYRMQAEKATGGEISLMAWSTTMDLIASAFTDNSVILNRLSWQRVWSIPPLESPVRALAWRPDGRVLAVGRADCSVCLYSVEDGHSLHKFSVTSPVSALQWVAASTKGEINSTDYSQFIDESAKFLPPLPCLDSRKCHHPFDPKQLRTAGDQLANILVVGDEVGRVHLCVSGVFLIAAIDTEHSSDVISICLRTDFQSVSAVTMTRDGSSLRLHLHTINTSLVAVRLAELQHLAFKCGCVGSVLEYMSAVLTSMQEAWEDILLMMDTKLANYSSTLPEGVSVSDELLVLLACGKARPELQTFLVEELTAKGVKKIGLSLELSYTNIRKFIVDYLNSAIQYLQYHLGGALGMAKWYERYGVLGLSEPAMQDCINKLGTFALKSQELLLAIDDSLQCTKTFFIWLHVVILKLADEPLPSGIKEHLNPDELKMVIEFLRRRLSKASEGGAQTFNLEVVGQYLSDEDLKYVEERAPSLWERLMKDMFLTENGSVPWLFQPEPHKSLVQLFHSLCSTIDSAFALPLASMKDSFVVEKSLELTSWRMEDSSAIQSKQRKYQALIGEFSHEGFHYLYFPHSEKATCIGLLKFKESGEVLECGLFSIGEVPSLAGHETEDSLNNNWEGHILSLQNYSEEALSVLLKYINSSEGKPRFAVAQLPIEALLSLPRVAVSPPSVVMEITNSLTSHDLSSALTQVLSLGHFKSSSLAVSGPRKLAAVLSCNGKKVRLFDVDAEEEEEEDEED